MGFFLFQMDSHEKFVFILREKEEEEEKANLVWSSGKMVFDNSLCWWTLCFWNRELCNLFETMGNCNWYNHWRRYYDYWSIELFKWKSIEIIAHLNVGRLEWRQSSEKAIYWITSKRNSLCVCCFSFGELMSCKTYFRTPFSIEN